MSYSSLAKEILKLVGGEVNVASVTHCATRLRFQLKDNKKADKTALNDLEGILTVVESAGEFQVVIGNHVAKVYNEMIKDIKIESDSDDSQKEKTKFSSRVFGVISGSFSPLIPVFAGSGMIKALLTILTLLNVLSVESSTYSVLNAAGNAAFYFLPILLGITCATKLGANPYLGGVLGAALLEPNFTGLLLAGETSSFAGLPIMLMDYASTVFPIFMAVCVFAVIEKYLKKVIHKDLQIFLVPMLCLLIMVPLTAIVIGPISVYVGNALGIAITFVIEKNRLIAGMILGAGWPFMVILGIHWGIIPIVLDNFTKGGDPIMGMAAIGVFSLMGLALGIFIKSKDKKVKAVAGAAFLPAALSGVTEPINYGLMMRYKRTIPYVVIVGAIGGAVSGMMGVKQMGFAFTSFLSLSAYSPMLSFTIIAVASLAATALLTIIFGYEDKEKVSKNMSEKAEVVKTAEENIYQAAQEMKILSPLTGSVKSLCELNDPVFASEAMGKGIAVDPTVGEVHAPVDGVVTTLLPSKHAIGITSSEGVEILIHVGINTVKLGGEHFTASIKQGDTVSQGDLLVEFNMEAIKKAGYELITPVIITNTANYVDVVAQSSGSVTTGEKLLKIINN